MPAMLTLQFKKRGDGGAALTLVRRDGSRTWQRQDRHAAFFAFHDLTHYAVESVLGVTRGFYGLVAEGWDFDDFGSDARRGELPPEALWVEELVGLLDIVADTDAPGTRRLNADELTRVLAERLPAGASSRAIGEQELLRIRSYRDALLARYAAVPAGDTFVLAFPGDDGAEPRS